MADSQMAGPGQDEFLTAPDKASQQSQDPARGTIGQEPGPACAKTVRSQIHGSKRRTRWLVQIIRSGQLGCIQTG